MDPQIVTFFNEHLRPRAEMIRAMNALIEDDINTWDVRIASLLPTKDDVILEDGRDAEGVSRLTVSDVNTFMTILKDMQAVLIKLGSQDAIRKPCVRPLEVKTL